MATMLVSNEKVIGAAQDKIRLIQEGRHKEECEAVQEIIKEFDSLTYSWVFKRDIKKWFMFGPFALLFILAYPFTIISRAYVVWNKPETTNIYEKAEYLDGNGDNMWDRYTYYLSSGTSSDAMETCLKLKCMANQNEDDYLILERKEVEQLGIC